MGLTSKSCEFLFHLQKRYDISWERTLTLGRQQMFISPEEATAMAARFGVSFRPEGSWKKETGYCEPFLKGFGAKQVDSMDASDYEEATIVHDLNNPVPQELHGRFDCILDGGTIEHVFHFPNAIRSCMDMLATGGHYVAITPADNQMGHGFYQFSPELYFRIFSEANGFEVRTMLLHTDKDWLEISDPRTVGYRGTLVSSTAVMLCILARKVRQTEGFHVPQQSDYVDAWSVVESIKSGSARQGESQLRHLVRKYVPLPVKTMLRKVGRSFGPSVEVEGLSGVDGKSYRRIRLY
ncbi:MAG TPA: hypothetical protein PKD45_01295 [Flavobacteriales bacterium]|nr:hypothetical protein [Flavobacteriales bacterium]